jgi:uncharacterized membrane protein
VIVDILVSALANTALNMMDSSIWQISKGANIIVIALLSKIFLKRIFTHKAIIGCIISLVGITIVQVKYILR